VSGTVKQRADRYINKDIETGTIELEAKGIQVIAKSAEMPFDMGGKELNLDLPTLLDHRALTLRHPKVQAIFKVQSVIIDSFREFMKSEGFFEFQAPSIAPAVAEGGSEVFEVNYFDQKAYLSQSPQLYKQIVMTAFERVFSVNKVFRAEPSVTTRHLTEVVSLDAEMAFIDSWMDVKDMADRTIKYIFTQLEKKCQKELALFNATIPETIEKTPVLSLREAQEKIFKRFGRVLMQ
jgi:nondiscriminating aspartyl-tRNA synthetase